MSNTQGPVGARDGSVVPEHFVPTDRSAAATRDRFAQVVRTSVAAGKLSGAVAVVATKRLLRMEAFGFRDRASAAPMEVDTILSSDRA